MDYINNLKIYGSNSKIYFINIINTFKKLIINILPSNKIYIIVITPLFIIFIEFYSL